MSGYATQVYLWLLDAICSCYKGTYRLGNFGCKCLQFLILKKRQAKMELKCTWWTQISQLRHSIFICDCIFILSESIQGSLVKYFGLLFVLFNVRHWSEAEEVKDGGWKRLLD